MNKKTDFIVLLRSAVLANIALLMTFLLLPILLLTDKIHIYQKFLQYLSYDSRFDNNANVVLESY